MLDKIITSCKYVTENSKSVKINEKKIDEFINQIKEIKPKHWLSFSPYNLLELPVDTIINFLLVYEAIDFSFWGNPKWAIDTPNGKEDGSIALLYAILKYVREKNTTDFSNITRDEFRKILKDRELFNIIIKYFPNFKDERKYREKTIYFYKLAQLLTSDILHVRELKEFIKVDYSNLVGCADYKIPQVMRGLGILEYGEELSETIDNKKQIEENSEYEVEIRASMLVVIDLIKKKLKNRVCAIDINDYIWGQGKNKNIELKPYHLTRNTNY